MGAGVVLTAGAGVEIVVMKGELPIWVGQTKRLLEWMVWNSEYESVPACIECTPEAPPRQTLE